MSCNKRENWGWTTFSGMPGPLESPYKSNIPALYGNPKYESQCHSNMENSNNEYIQKKQFPKCGYKRHI